MKNANKAECKKEQCIYGSPEYIKCMFGGITDAVYSKKSKVAKETGALVQKLSTDKDRMVCRGVIKVSGKSCDGESHTGYIAHITVGLNGQGRDSDYAAALKRLLDARKGIDVVDVHVDFVDDRWSVLVSIC